MSGLVVYERWRTALDERVCARCGYGGGGRRLTSIMNTHLPTPPSLKPKH